MPSVINEIQYYQDEPTVLQFHKVGYEVEGLFTGRVDNGGKYRDSYYFIMGQELNGLDFVEGEDSMIRAVDGFLNELRVSLDIFPKGLSLDEIEARVTINQDVFGHDFEGDMVRVVSNGVASSNLYFKNQIQL